MSLFSRVSTVVGPLVPPREPSKGGFGPVTPDSARRISAVWACQRLRADLISTMPVDAYRKVGGIQVEVTKPPVLVTPGGKEWPMHLWLEAGQRALDGAGNNVGIITARDGLGLPARVELQDLGRCSVIAQGDKISEWRIGGQRYSPEEIWHERQYVVPGVALGLSPTAYAAWTLGLYQSAQEFARDWFDGRALPSGTLKNAAKTIVPKESDEIKARFKTSVSNGDVFVYGKDWEYNPMAGPASDAKFLDMQQASIPDIARYYGCPADVIDAAVSGQAVTYANIGQRNLQLLIHNIGPSVMRREYALSSLLPAPRFVKLNSDALLRMDPETRAKMLGQQIRDRMRAPSEVRALENLQPYTEDQLAEFDRLFGRPNQAPTTAATGATS